MMDVHPLYGPVLLEKNWVPAPSYLLRRECILRQINVLAAGDLIEVGCGAGTLIWELNKRGFNCTALESSEEAISLAKSINGDKIEIFRENTGSFISSFDYLCAFEVLEHIEDDLAALKEWYSWLKPKGQLLLSVPAHQSKWSDSDVWAGHYRRYEKDQLLNLLSNAGFKVNVVECYGFPLANLLSPIRAFLHKKSLSKRGAGTEKKNHNDLSGVERVNEKKLFSLLKSPLGILTMKFGFKLQDMTIQKDWGAGYFIHARK